MTITSVNGHVLHLQVRLKAYISVSYILQPLILLACIKNVSYAVYALTLQEQYSYWRDDGTVSQNNVQLAVC